MSSKIRRESGGYSTRQSAADQRNGSARESRNFRGKGWLHKSPNTFNFTYQFRFQLSAVYHHLDDFCKLPEATKELYLRNSETGNHGYVKPGQERFDGKTKDVRHAYNICTLNLKLPEEVRRKLTFQ